MSGQQVATLQGALDIVEALPEDQQENLVHILQHRLIERRRELLVESIREARAEYARGEATRGSVDDFMRELAE